VYDPTTTARAVAIASQSLGWQLRYSTQTDVDTAIHHYNNLWDPDRGRLTRALSQQEQRFITNERKLCALDFRNYWLPRYAYIVNWQKQPQRFTPNVAQQIVMDLWAEDEAAGTAIMMQQLKARRLGVSTISELNVCHRYQFQPYSSCVVASADPAKTIEMAGIIKYALDQQPWWLLPQGDPKIKHGIPVAFPDMHNTLAIQAGNQFTGVARGSSPNVVHLSELVEWQDADQLIDGALLPSILDDPKVFLILESTGGPGWWEQKWEQVKRDWARRTGKIRPIFLPWYVGTDIYPTPADLRKRPIPGDWIPQDATVKHAERARQYVLSTPLLFKHLAQGHSNWQMPREQMWWREIGYQSAREQKVLHIFLAEYCADDFEAFQIQQNPLIDQEVLIAYQERTRDPIGVYTIVGPDIPPALVAPSRLYDTSKPTITIATRELLPRFDVKYQLIPLVFTNYSDFDEQLKLLIYEWPTFPHVYGVGVDCSEGVGQDNAAIEVLREATPMREPGQVAEWTANTVTAFQLWPLTLAISALYSTVNPQTSERSQCRLAIETWTNGAACQNELQKRGWYNFHLMHYAGDSKRPKIASQINRIGMMTNAVLRAAIQDLWMTHLKEEAIDLPSPYLVREITTLENVEGKAQAMLGKFDDRWMSLGFPLLSLHQGKHPSQQFQRKRVSYEPGLESDPPVSYPTWTPAAQSSSTPFKQTGQQIFRRRDKGALDRYRNPNLPIRFR